MRRPAWRAGARPSATRRGGPAGHHPRRSACDSGRPARAARPACRGSSRSRPFPRAWGGRSTWAGSAPMPADRPARARRRPEARPRPRPPAGVQRPPRRRPRPLPQRRDRRARSRRQRPQATGRPGAAATGELPDVLGHLLELRLCELVGQALATRGPDLEERPDERPGMQQGHDVTASCERRNGPMPSQSRTGLRAGSAGAIERGRGPRTCSRRSRSRARRRRHATRSEIANRIAPSAKNGNP